jgi:hypothetical protein
MAMRVLDKIEPAWLKKLFPKSEFLCDCGQPYFTCGKPAIACVMLFGWCRTNVCEWHLEPLTEEHDWAALNFLARMWVPVP